MRLTVILGIVLIVAGLAALTYGGITYTSRETVIDLGQIQATAERQRTIPLSPLIGLAAMGCGAALLIGGARRRA